MHSVSASKFVVCDCRDRSLSRGASPYRAPPRKAASRNRSPFAAPPSCRSPARASKMRTVIVSRGVITGVGKDVTFPQETWIIDGKGLTVYPGLFDSFTDVGLGSAATPTAGEGAGRPQQPISRGPEDRPGATPWRDAAGEATLADKRIETWRSGGFTTVISAHKGGIFPRPGRAARSRRRTQRRSRRKISGRDSGFAAASRQFRKFSRLADGHDRLRSSGLAGHRLEHQSRSDLRQESSRHGAPSLRSHRLRARRCAGRSRVGPDSREQYGSDSPLVRTGRPLARSPPRSMAAR